MIYLKPSSARDRNGTATSRGWTIRDGLTNSRMEFLARKEKKAEGRIVATQK